LPKTGRRLCEQTARKVIDLLFYLMLCYTPDMGKPKVIAIVGQTASGKTALAIDVAKHFAGEVISADSRQVYRGLDIGTGKVGIHDMAGVPHHLLDTADPTEVYTAADFELDAKEAIEDVFNRRHLPIVAGGSTFYVDVLRGRAQSAPVAPNWMLREKLSGYTLEDLFLKLQALDPRTAGVIDKKNRRRLERALEIVDALGAVPTQDSIVSQYDWLVIGTKVTKEQLLENYSRRLDEWLAAGFQAEVEKLLKSGISQSRLQELGFEYTLMLQYMEGLMSLTEFKEKFVQKNWQYAKRQMTWLKKDQEIVWMEPKNREAIFQLITTFLNEQPG